MASTTEDYTEFPLKPRRQNVELAKADNDRAKLVEEEPGYCYHINEPLTDAERVEDLRRAVKRAQEGKHVVEQSSKMKTKIICAGGIVLGIIIIAAIGAVAAAFLKPTPEDAKPTTTTTVTPIPAKGEKILASQY